MTIVIQDAAMVRMGVMFALGMIMGTSAVLTISSTIYIGYRTLKELLS